MTKREVTEEEFFSVRKRFGGDIHRVRVEKNLTEAELAERLGVTQNTVMDLEAGKVTIETARLRERTYVPKWAFALNITQKEMWRIWIGVDNPTYSKEKT